MLEQPQKSFFVINKQNDDVQVEALSKVFNRNDEAENLNIDSANRYLAFTDPSNNENPGWPLRLFLAALLEYGALSCGSEIKVIGIRCSKDGGVDGSRIYDIIIPEVSILASQFFITNHASSITMHFLVS